MRVTGGTQSELTFNDLSCNDVCSMCKFYVFGNPTILLIHSMMTIYCFIDI